MLGLGAINNSERKIADGGNGYWGLVLVLL